jgi:hypothetical protein
LGRHDVSDREPTSVLLPTTAWGPVCEQLRAGLQDGDELLVVCDTDADPVAGHDTPDGVAVVVAGEPEGCSGKANALAAGMERAKNDRFVWTDDDFERSPAWLDRLVTESQRHGPTTLLPDFVGGGWWHLAKPALLQVVVVRTLLVERRDDGEAFPWGGGVAFAREDLVDGVDALVADLRCCLSDDLVLDDHLRACRRDPELEATVRVDGDAAGVFSRLLRYLRADHVHKSGGLTAEFALWCPVAVAAALFPLPAAAAATVAVAVALSAAGQLRWHAALAYPAVLILPLLLAAGMVRTDVEWAGRRYRVRADDDVEVVAR